MGRRSTGATTTGEAIRIELSYLLKAGFIKKDSHITGTTSWTNGSKISVESKYYEDEAYLRLVYTNTSHYSGEETKHDYKIQLTTVPSNLGRGKVLYFVCPETGKNCRILYKCYGSLIWKSREAYRYRIYYTGQISSKRDCPNSMYFKIERRLNELYPKVKKSHYKGKQTRLSKKIEILEQRKDYFNAKRLAVLYNLLPEFHQMRLAEKGYSNFI